MAFDIEWYSERGQAFGRGSPVRDYWLEHCDGFEAIGTNGRHLGRVSRFATPQGAAFLRVGGRRSRVVPVSAVERVWPAASMLVIADPDVPKERDGKTPDRHFTSRGLRDERSQNASEGNLAASTSREPWEDETVPWWELVSEDHLAGETATPSHFPSVPKLPWSAMRQRAFSGGRALRELSELISDNSRKLVALVLRGFRRGWRVTRIGLRTVGKQCLAARAFGANLVTRARLRLGRLLIRLAVWVVGNDGQLGDEVARSERPSRNPW
jgi:hypothetical protein